MRCGNVPARERRALARLPGILAVAALLAACGCGDGGSGNDVSCLAPDADCTLREAAAAAGVRVGAAVREVFDSDPQYEPALVREFNSVTHEHALKWNAVQPQRGTFDFERADALVELAEANGMAVRGHTLIWEQQFLDSTPDYVTTITDPQELRELMAEHIRTVVGRYRGRIDAWDVVNEPLETLGSKLYENVFYRLLGPGYIAEAFELAHAADPDALLFLNETLVSTAGPKFDALAALVSELLDQGVPLHGVGIQGHFFAPPRPDELRANIEALADLGVVVEITELDIPVIRQGDRAVLLEEQRQQYYDVASACLAVPACRRITMWGFTDRHTWIDDFLGPGLAPLVLDENYQRKPAYFGLRDAFLDAARR